MYKAIKSFNRNTTWVATGLLGSVVFAALMVAFQEGNAKLDDLTKARQTTGDPLMNVNSTAIPDIVSSNQNSPGEITLAQVTSATRGIAFQIKHPDTQANATSWSPAQPDSVRVIRSKILNVRYRTFVRHRIRDVKMRLIALWHQSLAQSEKSRTWTAFSSSNLGERRKVGYRAETYH
jgi:mRNA-degrading endonuclease toxin of MazEF toxin-antitoxin module